jgi:hypothetical protein
MNTLRVFMADLTHDTVGLATEVFPLNVGLVGAYALKEHGAALDISLFKYVPTLEEAILRDPPDILALSNYPWCHNIDMAMVDLVKYRRQDTIIVLGGPNFPHDPPGQRAFLKRRPAIDAYVYLDGEVGFANLIGLVRDSDSLDAAKRRLRGEAVAGCRQLNESGALVSSLPPIRLTELDAIPSPYLTGLLDPFFDGRLSPMIQTNRGCPFRCTFCHDGAAEVNKVNSFSVERCKAEIGYIAEHVPPSVKNLFVSDLNFGMYKQDAEICRILAETRRRHDYPHAIDSTTGKNQKRRVIQAIEQLEGALRLTMSVQSLDSQVLGNIKRDNIRVGDFLDLQPAIRRSRLPTVSEVILGLPGETYESHLATLSELLEANMDLVVPHTLMLINGAEMSTPAERLKWGFKSAFRIIPRDFTRLRSGRKVVEVEEVVVETSTLSFADYIAARKMAFLIQSTNNPGFKPIIIFLRQSGVKTIDFLSRLLAAAAGRAKPLPAALIALLDDFERDTRGELWPSEDALVEHSSKDENYQALLEGRAGINILQTYHARMVAGATEAVSQALIEHGTDMLSEKNVPEAALARFREVVRFAAARSFNLLGPDRLEVVPVESFTHDIPAWLDDPDRRPLGAFALDRPRSLRFALTPEQFRDVERQLDLFGHSLEGKSKALIRIPATALWRRPVEAAA